ncbi:MULTISPECIES: hypothetical protein [unclassified Frankia]|uniref:hypothetical protein n=2 Tax=Frankia TaxID=1854 RepID=UPI002AD1E8FF|nr:MULTISPECIES: hypothetical protein [unclassified Frankia]
MPPVTLTATPLTALTPDLTCSGPASALMPVTVTVTQPGALANAPAEATGPRLRLVATSQLDEIVHGRSGPSSCGCRECAMARHPASMPRLTVIR